MSRYTDWIERTHVPHQGAALAVPTRPRAKKVHTRSRLWRFSVTLTWLCLIGAAIGTWVAVQNWHRGQDPIQR